MPCSRTRHPRMSRRRARTAPATNKRPRLLHDRANGAHLTKVDRQRLSLVPHWALPHRDLVLVDRVQQKRRGTCRSKFARSPSLTGGTGQRDRLTSRQRYIVNEPSLATRATPGCCSISAAKTRSVVADEHVQIAELLKWRQHRLGLVAAGANERVVVSWTPAAVTVHRFPSTVHGPEDRLDVAKDRAGGTSSTVAPAIVAAPGTGGGKLTAGMRSTQPSLNTPMPTTMTAMTIA